MVAHNTTHRQQQEEHNLICKLVFNLQQRVIDGCTNERTAMKKKAKKNDSTNPPTETFFLLSFLLSSFPPQPKLNSWCNYWWHRRRNRNHWICGRHRAD